MSMSSLFEMLTNPPQAPQSLQDKLTEAELKKSRREHEMKQKNEKKQHQVKQEIEKELYIQQNIASEKEQMKMMALQSESSLSALGFDKKVSHMRGRVRKAFSTSNYSAIDSVTQGTSTIASSKGKDDLITKIVFPHLDPLPINQPEYEMKLYDFLSGDDRILLIQGNTGCGKTTRIPLMILKWSKINGKKCKIIVSQPRRLAAISVAKRVCDENNWNLGGIVGYQISLEKIASEENSRILYCTTGILGQMLFEKGTSLASNSYTCVILDEMHERSIDMDLAAVACRHLVHKYDMKLIIMSATMELKELRQYFKYYNSLAQEISPEVIIIKECCFNVEINYLTDGECDGMEELRISDELYRKGLELIYSFDMKEMEERQKKSADELKLNQGTVLVFLPGMSEILKMEKCLKEDYLFLMRNLTMGTRLKFDICRLHSNIPTSEQRSVFATRGKYRRVILSTNIAESSITVPDVKYVIDYGRTKAMACDVRSSTNFAALQLQWASQQSMKQRAGRTGRTMEGVVYRMMTRRQFENLSECEVPELDRTPLHSFILKAKLINLWTPKNMLGLTINPPYLQRIKQDILVLKQTGALLKRCSGPCCMQHSSEDNASKYDDTNGDITDLGKFMVKMPLDIRCAKLIFNGFIYGNLDDCIIMAAGMSARHTMCTKPSVHDTRALTLSYTKMLEWCQGTMSDPIAFLNAYKHWSCKFDAMKHAKRNIEEWCDDNYVDHKGMLEVRLLENDLKMRVKRIFSGWGIEITQAETNNKGAYTGIYHYMAIAGAFYPNYFIRKYKGSIESVKVELRKELNYNNPYDTIYVKNIPNGEGWQYAQQIKQIFALAAPPHQIQYSYDEISSKFFLHFAHEDETNKTPIPIALYRALKLASKSLSLHANDGSSALARNVTKLKEKQCARLHEGRYLDIAWPWGLLDFYATYIPIKVVMMCAPAQFYAQSAGAYDMEVIREIEKVLANCELDGPLSDFDDFTKKDDPGMFVVCYADAVFMNITSRPMLFRAIYIDTCKYPGTVLYKMKLIDYGLIVHLGSSDIYLCPADIAVYPPMAVKFQINGISNEPSRWDEFCTDTLRTLLEQREVTVEIYAHIGKIIYVHLMHPNGQRVQSIFPESSPSWLTRSNHEDRMAKYLVPPSLENLPFVLTIPPSKKTNDLVIHLGTPYTSLHMSLFSTSSGVTHTPKLDSHSVNSVLLDTDPTDPHERLLVAGDVALYMTNNLVLNMTTLMPAIAGLSAIIQMLNSPCVNLKVNKYGSRYAGACCGLGLNDDNEPCDPEKDANVMFDVIFSQSDVEKISRIRDYINEIFVRLNENALLYCGKIREETINLIGTEFKEKSQENFGIETDKQDFIPIINVSSTIYDTNFVYEPMVIPRVKGDPRERSALEYNVKFLNAFKFDYNERNNVTCVACNESFHLGGDLENHLRLELHHMRVKAILQD